jgi:hypothetical protein
VLSTATLEIYSSYFLCVSLKSMAELVADETMLL